MNEAQRGNCEMMRSMDSSEAADWLLLNHPEDGCFYISKRSWKREEQIRLAEHFLEGISHASGICYEALLSIMALPRFTKIIGRHIPQESSDRDLLRYYLFPALNKFSKTKEDKAAVAHIKGLLGPVHTN